jgi:hypothetical protein
MIADLDPPRRLAELRITVEVQNERHGPIIALRGLRSTRSLLG